MDSRLRTSKNEIFQRLKPYCVDLSQLARTKDGDNHALIQSTERLLGVLQAVYDDDAFDEKLADYVFFPLSQILRTKQSYTDRLSELTAKCLRLLLEHGWRNVIAVDLAKQLLILLTLMVGGVPGQDSKVISEELAIEALGGLAALFRDLSRTPEASITITEASTIPAVGHCVTTVLDSITEGSSANVQTQALKALGAIWTCIKDVQAQASFLPGTVSALTKCLMPSTSSRRTRKTIILGIETMQLVLTTVLSDIKTRNIKASNHTQMKSANDSKQEELTQAWLNATTSQIKLALANVVKLRTHQSEDVRVALNRFCVVLLDECHDTLIDSTSMLVETCLSLAGVEDDTATAGRTTIADLAAIHPNIGESIKNTFYHWVSSLPRVLQMNDESAKVAALHQLSTAYQLLGTLNLVTSILDDALSQSLRDGVSGVIEASSLPRMMQEASLDSSSQALTVLSSEGALVRGFRPILMPEESQKSTRVELSKFLSSVGTSQSRMSMANEMLDYVRGSSGPSLLAAYWISSQLIENAATKNEDMDEFFESTLLLPEDFEATSQDLFSYSMSVLSEGNDLDWRMTAIALEVVSRSAQRLKKDFRVELVDILYPVSQLLGSPSRELRERATVCLNIISDSCGYSSTRELIVENVDYMVNAISLKLNTFDISPQAPQVLVMMIRLTGPSLLPYLDDVVSAMFAALDNFHGYQGLVEGLFAVLSEIVETGAHSQQLLLPNAPVTDETKGNRPRIALTDVVQAIGKQQQRVDIDPALEHEDFPRKPWKGASELLNESDTGEGKNEDENGGAAEIEKLPPTKTYSMVQSIARLCQHYLTNQSPALRTRLLGLISTSSLALKNDQESFLPLINDIWPVVIERLYDKESFVAIAAANTITTICRCAGNFLATRIAVQWSRLMGLARRARTNMLAEKTGSGGRGVYSQAAQMWESMVKLLSTIVECTGINDEAFDDVLELLENVIVDRLDVRDALAATNPDAVWLVLQAGGCEELQTPILEGYQFLPLNMAVAV